MPICLAKAASSYLVKMKNENSYCPAQMQYTADIQDFCSAHELEVRRGNGTTVRMVDVMQYQISHAASLHSSWPSVRVRPKNLLAVSAILFPT